MSLVEYLIWGIGFGKFKNSSVTLLIENLKEVRLIEDQSDSLYWMTGGEVKFTVRSCLRQLSITLEEDMENQCANNSGLLCLDRPTLYLLLDTT